MAEHGSRGSSARQTFAVLLLLSGFASVCFGLYSLIQAFDVFNLSMAFKVWFARAVVTLAIGVVALHTGGRRLEKL
ncbi:hypothetical protein FAZ69_17205 [Trinickia terrae]|uniref:Uncharacterized protein n=1 Tax=Trinickia terrae TaxID=2571161 RepID=A0A4U1I4B9_9BURK|nr:hypothetical protein FAZ69_17205 [Trinickia terrae]